MVASVPADATTGPVYVAVGENYVTEGPVFTVEQPLEPKTLQVEISTEGPTGDGYTLSVTGQDSRFVEPNGSVLYSDIFENEVTVELSGLGDNCTVGGENPRVVDLNNSDNAGYTAFNVSCTGPAPTIESIAPDSGTTGTQVTITGSNFSSTASDNIVTFNGVRAELNSAAATELVAFVPFDATTGPVEVTVNGQTATGPTFTVITTGRLEVNISTTGTSIDPDGYGLILDGGAASVVNVNDLVAYDDLSEGSHSIELTDIASNCFITQDRTNPYNVGVMAGDTTVTNIDIQCDTPAPEITSISPTIRSNRI
ncbi:MAG: IPT/TIG domain-containing protein [Gracilimonas sp.]|nr:IPT/TIG domain-containing protein [Gracilimonas sp.]